MGHCGAQGGTRCCCWGRMLGSHLRVAGLCLPEVGSPLQMVQAGMSALRMASASRKNSGHVVRFCPCLQLRSSEKLLPIPLFCIVATAVVWAAALYFFFQTLSSWEVKFPFHCPSVHLHLLSSFLPVVCLHKKHSGEESWAAHGELKGFNSFSRLGREHGKLC